MCIAIGLPGGKSLEEGVRILFAEAGITIVGNAGSTHSVRFPNYPALREGIFMKPFRIPVLVENGTCDVGITGVDTVLENGASVEVLTRLAFGRSTEGGTRGVLYASQHDPIDKIEDIPPGTKILSEYPHLTRAFFEERRLAVEVIPSSGSSEAEVPRCYRLGVVLSETGNSLRKNSLKLIAEIFSSATCLVANRTSLEDPVRRQEIETLQAILVGVLEARGKVLLSMNVQSSALTDVLAFLPSLGSPTIAPLANGGSSVSIVTTKAVMNSLVRKLREKGVTGIIATSITSIIP